MMSGDGSLGTAVLGTAARIAGSLAGGACMGADASSREGDERGPADATGDEASDRAPVDAERRFTTVGRMRSSTVVGDFAFSRWRFTRSTTSGPMALM
jgi:hypothetical protein